MQKSQFTPFILLFRLWKYQYPFCSLHLCLVGRGCSDGKWGWVSLSSTCFICLPLGRALQLCLKYFVQHHSAECILLMPSRTSQHLSKTMMFIFCSNTFMNVSFQAKHFSWICLTFSIVGEELITHLRAQNSSPSTCGLSFVNHIFASVRTLASVPEFN